MPHHLGSLADKGPWNEKIVMKSTTIPYILGLLLFSLPLILIACQGSSETVREFNVSTPEISLHGTIAGNQKSACMLIGINGWPGLTSSYMLDLQRLAGHECAVVTYDQRGLGKSSQPLNPDSPESYSLTNYAIDVEAIRQALDVDRVHLFGHSFGGVVAMQYAVLFPEHVESMIFFGGGPPTWDQIQASQMNFLQRVQSLMEEGVIPPQDQWVGKGIEPLLPAYFSDPAFTFPTDSLGSAPEFNQKVNELTYQNLEKLDLRAELRPLQKRVLLMMGRDDPFGLQMAEAIREALPNSFVEFELIDNCGHFWHECPEAFYPMVKKFLKAKKTEGGN